MRYLLLIGMIFSLTSCSYTIHQMSKLSKSGTYPIDRMESLEGGITANDNIILTKMTPPENHIFTVNDKACEHLSIVKVEGEYKVTGIMSEKVIRMVPIYTKKQKIDEELDEYIKIFDSSAQNLSLECKFAGKSAKTIDVDIRFNKDPTFSKRLRTIALSVPFTLLEGLMGFGGVSTRRLKR